MTSTLFFYDMLQFPPAIEAVTGSSFSFEKATARNLRLFVMKGSKRPAMVKCIGREVAGTVYYGVDQKSLERIEAFEGEDLSSTEIRVSLKNGKTVEAGCFVLSPKRKALLSTRSWNAKVFEDLYLDRFVKQWSGRSRVL